MDRLESLDPCGEAGNLARGRIARKNTALGASLDDRLRLPERGFGRILFTSHYRRFDLSDEGAHAAPAIAIDLGTPRVATDTLLG